MYPDSLVTLPMWLSWVCLIDQRNIELNIR